MRRRRNLVIFLRQPRLGSVKRRLSRDIGAVGALRLYRRMTTVLIDRLGRDRRWQTWLAVTPTHAARQTRRIWRTDLPSLPQANGDLGTRMLLCLRRFPKERTIIVGSDIPGITAGHVMAAFHALDAADWVLGPAEDGGYWLIGTRRRPIGFDPFLDVRWSSSATLGDTLANLGERRVALVNRLRDLDTVADLKYLTSSLERH